MYILKRGYLGKPRITTTEYYALPDVLKSKYEAEEEPYIQDEGETIDDDHQSAIFGEDNNISVDNDDDTPADPEPEKFQGFGGGDFGGGGSSGDWQPNTTNVDDKSGQQQDDTPDDNSSTDYSGSDDSDD